MGREIGGEGFEDLNEPAILELIQHQDQLTAQKLYAILTNSQQDEEESLLIDSPTLKKLLMI